MLEGIWTRYCGLTNRIKTSIAFSAASIGLISTVMTVAGVSLHDWTQNVWISLLIIMAVSIGIGVLAYYVIGRIFKDSVSATIGDRSVLISYGDIFKVDAWRVIGCDTHFDTRVDDCVISKKSLHGQLVLYHGKAEEIKAAVEREAERLDLAADKNGLYSFPLGTIIRYDSSVDQRTYLMLAMTELDERHRSHSNIAKFEQMLMEMWEHIDSVYAGNDVALPLLGSGITRFDDGKKDNEALLRCMLCTLNSSGVTLNSRVQVVISGDCEDVPLYEYKNVFRSVK